MRRCSRSESASSGIAGFPRPSAAAHIDIITKSLVSCACFASRLQCIGTTWLQAHETVPQKGDMCRCTEHHAVEKSGDCEALTVQVLQRQDGEDIENADPPTGHSNLHARSDSVTTECSHLLHILPCHHGVCTLILQLPLTMSSLISQPPSLGMLIARNGEMHHVP